MANAPVLVQRDAQRFSIRTLCRLMDNCLPAQLEDETDMQQLINKLWPALVTEQEVDDAVGNLTARVRELEQFIYDLTHSMEGGDLLAYSGASDARHTEMLTLMEQVKASHTPDADGPYLLPTERITVKAGATAWMKDNGFWTDDLDERASIDLCVGTVSTVQQDEGDGPYHQLRLDVLPQVLVELPPWQLERAV